MAYFDNNTIVYLDGEYIPAGKATTSVYNQSLHYGYAVFEGIRAYNTANETRIFKAKEHFERLIYSCKALHIPFEYSVEDLTAISYEVLSRNNISDAYIRPLVYATHPMMTLIPPSESSLFISAWDWGRYLGDKLLRLVISSYERPNPKGFHMEAKASGHYVNSTLATAEAKAKGYDEALLLDSQGFIAEGPGANFFFEKDGVLYTTPRGTILPGITRNTIIDLARYMGIDVKEELFTFDAVKGTDGAFYTGTAAEVAGIASINDIPFKKPYEETLGYQLGKRYKALVLQTEKQSI